MAKRTIDQVLGVDLEQTRPPRSARTLRDRARETPGDRYEPPDGVQRPTEEEFRLNEALMIAFMGDAGEQALAYLRSITVHQVIGPGGPFGDRLTHLEGARWLLGIIETRIAYGELHLPERDVPRGIAGESNG